MFMQSLGIALGMELRTQENDMGKIVDSSKYQRFLNIVSVSQVHDRIQKCTWRLACNQVPYGVKAQVDIYFISAQSG